MGYLHGINDAIKVTLFDVIILPEHQSDTKVFTMTMKILPELTSNKLCGSKTTLASDTSIDFQINFDSIGETFSRCFTHTVLFALRRYGNLDGGSSWSKTNFRYSDTTRLPLSDGVLKLKNFKKDGYSSFQDKEKYEHVGLKVTSSQEGKRSQDDNKILDLANDLKEAQDHIQVKLKEQAQY
ncbi:hypothetical protein Tco_0842250 [Tanacetum coccineum]|uniref:Uncharacterized protein n=1 Tax=Tanacetum coccineum TaxID=301880 RepID=A0ABQ5B2J9_9ASTR